jgi:hypothetical protein
MFAPRVPKLVGKVICALGRLEEGLHALSATGEHEFVELHLKKLAMRSSRSRKLERDRVDRNDLTPWTKGNRRHGKEASLRRTGAEGKHSR